MKNMIKILIATIFIVGSLVSCESDLNDMQQEENWGFDGTWETSNIQVKNGDIQAVLDRPDLEWLGLFTISNNKIINPYNEKTLNKDGTFKTIAIETYTRDNKQITQTSTITGKIDANEPTIINTHYIYIYTTDNTKTEDTGILLVRKKPEN